MPRFFGINHSEIFESLSPDWLNSGAPICFIQGFAGVGKRAVAEKLMGHLEDSDWMIPEIVDLPDSPANALNDLLLDISEELSLCNEDTMSRAVERGHSLEKALEKVLINQKVLIIIDKFHRSFVAGSNQPIDSIHNFLQKISRRRKVTGRILILTNKLIDETEFWSTNYKTKILDCLLAEEAIQLLEKILTEIK